MKLLDLLDELRNNLLRDTSGLLSGGFDRVWSDASLVRYINDAQSRFLRRSQVLRDSTTPELTQVALLTGVAEYVLDPRVYAVLSVRYEDDNADLPFAGHTQFSGTHAPETLWWDVNSYPVDNPDRPRAWGSDERDFDSDAQIMAEVIRVYPVPSAVVTGKRLYLRVARGATEPFSADNPEAVCIVPDEYVLNMLHWAAYRALTTSDIDRADPAKAAMHKQAFEDSIRELTQEARRRMQRPIKWGFGRNGSSYER